MKNLSIFSVLLHILLLFPLSGCAPEEVALDVVEVDLSDLQFVPTLQESDILPFRVAIGAVISPEGTADSYGPLLDYLAVELGRPIELVQRRTYAEINNLIKTGDIDLAFVCTSAYLAGRREFDMKLLVAPKVNGSTYYQSHLIVPVNSSANSILDLRGTTFAFTDPMSFTGRIHPTYLLQLENEEPSSFFKNTFFTYSHDDAIRAVANGLADGAAVDSLVLDFALSRDGDLNNKIKIIHSSEPFGIPPVVVGPEIQPQLAAQLVDIFLNFHTNEAGQNALQALDYDQFVIVPPQLYDAIEAIEALVVDQMETP